MTKLIESGNSQKIAHLEKIRQKILKRIIKSIFMTNKISNIFDK